MNAAPRLEHARLVGELVELRPLSLDDVGPAFELLHRNDAILRWLVWDGPDRVEDLHPYYGAWARHARDGSDYQLAIVERATGRFVGSISPRFAGHPGQGDLGYWLAPDVWGRGYMSEAVQLASHLCFAHLGAVLLYGYVFVGNHGSRRVLERAGFTLEHTAEKMTVKRGVPVDEWYLVASRPEWTRRFPDYAPLEEDVRLTARS